MIRRVITTFFISIFYLLLINANTFAQSQGDVVINEIMYAPTAGMSKEWFEIYNKSLNPVNLNNWKWKDATLTLRTITLQNVILNPNSFAVVCEDSIAVKTFYTNFSGIILQPTNGWSALNNTGDQLILYNSSGSSIDSVNYFPSWGGSSGNRSLERILASGPSNQSSNWSSSIAPLGATPNSINSLTPRQNDLSLNRITFSPSSPLLGDTLRIIANIKNRGLQPSSNFSVSFYEDFNRDSLPALNELIITLNSQSTLNSGDSIDFTIFDVLDSAGFRLYIAKVNFSLDEDTTNNKKVSGINVGGGSTAGSVIINEIMYDFPAGECEWIELFNNSDSVVNLKNWKIQDNTSTQVIITTSDFFLSPDSFVVISENTSIFINHQNLLQRNVIINSSLPSFNNEGDAVKIYKINGILSDRVDYFSSWGGENASLERRLVIGISNDSTNWITSIDCEKSTPARINSISYVSNYLYYDLVINEIMASPFTNEAEWIELYNPTNKTINLSNWLMYESGGDYKITDTCIATIKPGNYVVFASDTTILNR
ncbi:MAG: lamin tail domain-containing protein, partial [Ignavibacteria bacterium]